MSPMKDNSNNKPSIRGKGLTSDEIQSLRTNPPLLLSEAELAIVVGVSVRGIRNYERRGLLPFIRIGRRKLYRRDAVFKALENMEFKPAM